MQLLPPAEPELLTVGLRFVGRRRRCHAIAGRLQDLLAVEHREEA